MRLFILYGLISLVFSFKMYSQPYHPLVDESLVWDFAFLEPSNCIADVCTVKRYYFQGKQEIKGQIYSTLYIRNIDFDGYNPPFVPPYEAGPERIIAYMREDTAARKVYLFREADSVEVLLYDFGLQIGDTLFMDSSPSPGYEDYFVLNDSITGFGFRDGTVRRTFNSDNLATFTEGIGSHATPYWFPGNPNGPGVGYRPLCIWENWVLQYDMELAAIQCDQIVGISPGKDLTSLFQVYPSWVTDGVTVEAKHPLALPSHYQVVNSIGKTLKVGQLHSQTNGIEVQDLNPGVYMLVLTGKEGRVVFRFVKEE